MQKTVVLISFHHYLSKRKAGFHWIAHSFENLGWDVIFVTAPLSPFSRLIHDHRWEYVNTKDLNRAEKIDEHVIIYTHSPYYSPISTTGHECIDLLSPILIPIYKSRIPARLSNLLKRADIVIFESTAAILLFDLVKKCNPKAKFIYRVSDSLEILRVHQSVIEFEKLITPCFDLVSVPSQKILSRFPVGKTCLQHHGINKSAFSQKLEKPAQYGRFEKNIIFVGNSYFDLNFITIASGLFPHIGFHLIGPINNDFSGDNVLIYGEMPFKETIPFIFYADVGLQIRRMEVGLDTLSDSLKILQYTWCQLPIIAPFGLESLRKHIIYYQYDVAESIGDAINQALNYDRSRIDRSDIMDWEELTIEMLRKVDIPV
jgi:2-beta-glucuronyltransferase